MTFLDRNTESTDNKSKNRQVGLHQINQLLHSQGINQQSEKATYRKGEMFAHRVTDKGLIPKIYKKLIQVNNHNRPNFQKCVKDLNKHFSEEDLPMAKR